MLAVGFILGIFKETLITFLVLLVYRGATGGFHLKTHLGCILTTCLMYCGIALISKFLVMGELVKYLTIAIVWLFGIIMIKLYAPADTENVPILRKKDRRKKQLIAYISLTIAMILALIIKDKTVSNILIIGHFIQTITITKIAYILTNNKYGYEVYGKTSNEIV